MSDQSLTKSPQSTSNLHWALIVLCILLPWVGIIAALGCLVVGLVRDGTRYLKFSKQLFLWSIVAILMWLGLSLLLSSIPFVGTWTPSRP
ncbi:hypothetical protein DFR27_0732 [Umboniibacter marinipuniceus]|uniref:Uncharacterized protein n=1 Tax=Umboniibacter marinipuniceus TaxID=569599 RepID=A0A3M0A788_9GAMM|nr:hypothetical protein DFR27_0732 [Umboniibacter marinipuniceus]